jgi:hypothetical protein
MSARAPIRRVEARDENRIRRVPERTLALGLALALAAARNFTRRADRR